MNRATKMKVLNKLLKAGFDSEEAIREFDFLDIDKTELVFSEMKAVGGLKEAIKNRKIISYLAEDEDEKEGEEEAAEPGAEAADPQKKVILDDVTKHKEVPIKVPEKPMFIHEKGKGETNDND